MHRTAIIFAVLAAACDSATDLYDTVETAPTVSIQFEPATVDADGASYTTVRVKVADPDSAGPGVVLLRVSIGSLGGSSDTTAATLALGDDGVATARWKAPTTKAIGEATVVYGTTVTIDSVAFATAAPESVRLSVSAFAVPATPAQTVTLTLHTERTSGIVSERPAVVWAAVDTADTSRGQFGAETWTPGAASVPYTAGPTGYIGPLDFTATVYGTPSGDLVDTIRVWITAPLD